MIETQENDGDSQALMTLLSNCEVIKFVADSGCSVHMVTSDAGMTNVKFVSRRIMVANGQSLSSAKSGDRILFSDTYNKTNKLS
jgi:hypothetical protein